MSLALLMAGFSFDANTVAPDAGQMGPVPAGWYSVIVEHSEIKPTNDGSGAYIAIREKVIEPQQFAGSKIFHNFNIKNNNQQAVDIAMGQLSALSHAVQVLGWQDTQQLHNIPHKVRVKVRKGDGNYADQNQITAFKGINEAVTLGPEGGATAGPANPVPQHPGAGAPQVQQPQAQPAPQQNWNQNPTAPQQPQFAPQQQQAPQQIQQPVQQQQQPAPQQVAQPWEQQQQPQQQPQVQPQQQPVYQPQAQQQQQPVQQQQPQQQYQQPTPAPQVQQQQQPQPDGSAVPPWVGQA